MGVRKLCFRENLTDGRILFEPKKNPEYEEHKKFLILITLRLCLNCVFISTLSHYYSRAHMTQLNYQNLRKTESVHNAITELTTLVPNFSRYSSRVFDIFCNCKFFLAVKSLKLIILIFIWHHSSQACTKSSRLFYSTTHWTKKTSNSIWMRDIDAFWCGKAQNMS